MWKWLYRNPTSHNILESALAVAHTQENVLCLTYNPHKLAICHFYTSPFEIIMHRSIADWLRACREATPNPFLSVSLQNHDNKPKSSQRLKTKNNLMLVHFLFNIYIQKKQPRSALLASSSGSEPPLQCRRLTTRDCGSCTDTTHNKHTECCGQCAHIHRGACIQCLTL